MREPEGEGPPRPSLQLLPMASDPKGRKPRRRAGRRVKEDGAEHAKVPRDGKSDDREDDH